MDDAAGYGHNLVSTASPVRSTIWPTQLTSFVGRKREMAEVRRLLRSNRLVTLTGVGGVGKTRLALEVADSLLDEVHRRRLVRRTGIGPDAACGAGGRSKPWHPRTTGTLVRVTCATPCAPNAVARVGQLRTPARSVRNSLNALLHDEPQLVLLATSREPLNVVGEVSWPVPALAVNTVQPTISGVGSGAIVRGASDAVRPDFRQRQTRAAVAERVHRLDGLPLAIELAAARTRALPVRALLQTLESAAGGLPVLTGGPRGVPERQRTLRAADQLELRFARSPTSKRSSADWPSSAAAHSTLWRSVCVAAEPALARLRLRCAGCKSRQLTGRPHW